MITVRVKSTLLQSASFDARRREMQVQFVNGTKKTYCSVSRMTFLQLVRARSSGRFYRRAIMGKFAQVSETRKAAGKDVRGGPGGQSGLKVARFQKIPDLIVPVATEPGRKLLRGQPNEE